LVFFIINNINYFAWIFYLFTRAVTVAFSLLTEGFTQPVYPANAHDGTLLICIKNL